MTRGLRERESLYEPNIKGRSKGRYEKEGKKKKRNEVQVGRAK